MLSFPAGAFECRKLKSIVNPPNGVGAFPYHRWRVEVMSHTKVLACLSGR